MSVTSDKSQDQMSQQTTINITESKELQLLFKNYESPVPIVDLN